MNSLITTTPMNEAPVTHTDRRARRTPSTMADNAMRVQRRVQGDGESSRSHRDDHDEDECQRSCQHVVSGKRGVRRQVLHGNPASKKAQAVDGTPVPEAVLQHSARPLRGARPGWEMPGSVAPQAAGMDVVQEAEWVLPAEEEPQAVGQRARSVESFLSGFLQFS